MLYIKSRLMHARKSTICISETMIPVHSGSGIMLLILIFVSSRYHMLQAMEHGLTKSDATRKLVRNQTQLLESTRSLLHEKTDISPVEKTVYADNMESSNTTTKTNLHRLSDYGRLPASNDSLECDLNGHSPKWPNFICYDKKSCFTIQGMCDGYDDCGDSSDECMSLCKQVFSCQSSGKCLALDRFCDGVIDCKDGSDEIYVENSNDHGIDEKSYGFVCANTWTMQNSSAWNKPASKEHSPLMERKCRLPDDLVCDGINHCGDHSDECNAGCNPDSYFMCDNGKCIAGMHRCDWNDDCGDGSDECQGCSSTFHCNDGTCIPQARFCDGQIDCADRSDEIYSVSNNSTYENGQQMVVCDNRHNLVTTRCLLPFKYICDGHEHCLHREDECVAGCLYSFLCGNGNCVTSAFRCDGEDNCGDMSDECNADCLRTFECANGKCLAMDKFCNGVDDCGDGTDEQIPTSYSVNGSATYCASSFSSDRDKRCLLPPQYVCDGIDHCLDRTEECINECQYSFFCDGGSTCVGRTAVCDGNLECRDGADEVKSSTALASLRGFKCHVNRSGQRRACVLPQKLINDTVVDCDDSKDVCEVDGVENATSSDGRKEKRCMSCISDGSIIVSRRQVCDGAFDCPDLSDECLCQDGQATAICSAVCFTNHIPHRCPCPLGQVPCLQSSNDDRESTYFEREKHAAYEFATTMPKNKTANVDDNAIVNDIQCIDANFFCDGVVHCQNGADERACGRTLECANSPITVTPISTTTHTTINKCKPNHICTKHKLGNIWTPKYAIKCDGNPECFDLEDECSAGCPEPIPLFCKFLNDEGFFACPENAILPGIKVCDGGRNCTQSGQDEVACPGRFYCTNGSIVSVEKHRRCDFKSDCEDASDEKNCNDTHFYCEGGNPYYVPLRRKFDGKNDCFDGSDECPANSFDNSIFSSREHLIDNIFLNVMVWVMGLLSVIGNTSVMIHTVRTMIKEKKLSNVAKIYNFLVFNLSVADMLMGIFLLTLGTESALMSGRYCREDRAWRSGVSCKVLGVMATISSETSIVILAILSSYRLNCVIQPIKSREFRLLTAAVIALFAWLGAIIVAVLPLTPFLANYFVTEAWLATNPYFISDVVDWKALETFTKILQTYLPKGSNISTTSYDTMSWELMSETLTRLDPNYKTFGYFGYYSTHAVCLPKIFVTREESAWQYSFVLTTFNFLTFIYIVVAYMMMWRPGPMARNRTKSAASRNARNMQKRIAMLVATDFACWVPTCMIGFLCLAGVNVSSTVYALAAIVLLPINSALNPILYSNALHGVWSGIKRFVVWCMTATGLKIGDAREMVGNDNSPIQIRLFNSAKRTSGSDTSDRSNIQKHETVALSTENDCVL